MILTALGDGARRYVVDEFSAIGTNLVIVLPGRSDTRGFNPANLVTSTPRDLTVNDASALLRLPGVMRIAPIVVATTEINAAGKLREAMMVGTNADFIHVRQLKMGLGRFLSVSSMAVSYTHLDVYKRQVRSCSTLVTVTRACACDTSARAALQAARRDCAS